MKSLRHWLRRVVVPGQQAIGASLGPVSRSFGLDRGLPIDRWYIEQFLASQQDRVRGSVLEVGDATYTRRFGGMRVTESHVLHAVPGNSQATVIGDLSSGEGIPTAAYDTLVLTQVLPFIYDIHGAVRTLHRCLRPGGAALLTVNGICQVSRYDMDRWGDFWRFTDRSMSRLLGEAFPVDAITIATHGNALAASAFLYGLASAELSEPDLLFHDPDYQVLITAVVVKPG